MSAEPDPGAFRPPRFEVTVYQMGWRLGGKGASGRNRERADRIEEHGFHLFFGFYDNAFAMIQRMYGELATRNARRAGDRTPDRARA